MTSLEHLPKPPSQKSSLDPSQRDGSLKRSRRVETAALAELARRELIRRDLLEYNRYFWREKTWFYNWYHQEVAGIIQDAIAQSKKDNRRINITFAVPPGHSKSQMVTRALPGWFLGNYPDGEVIVATASQDRSDKFGREIREKMNDPEYAACFPKSIPRMESNSQNYIETQGGGKLVMAGAGSMIQGLRAGLLIGDDVVKDREFAESESQMEGLWDWFNNTFMARRYPACVTIIMHTRWALSDLIGRIKDTDKSGLWRHISYPAIAMMDEDHRKTGEALIEDFLPRKMLEEERQRLIDSGRERDWLALYQQEPTNLSGDFFKSEWLDFVPMKDWPKDEDLEWYIGCDFAASTKKTADCTALFPIGIDKRADLWFAPDAVLGRFTTLEYVDKLLDLIKKYKPVFIASEKGPLNAAVMPILRKRMEERNIWCKVEEISRSQGKYIYAAPLQARMQAKKVHWPDTSFYKLNVAPQYLNFTPGVDGQADDAVDGPSNLLMVLEKLKNWRPTDFKPKQKSAADEDKEMWEKILKYTKTSEEPKIRRINGKAYT